MRLAIFLLTSAFAVTAATSLTAQQPAKRPMTFADLMAMKRVSDPQISPSGKWVLFSVTDVSLEKNKKTNHLWVVPLDGSAKERQVTFGDGESNGRFAPDGKTIALTMKDQIFEMPWDDAAAKVGDAIQLTNVNGGADGAIWSPDSKRLMFVVDVYPECSDLGDWAKEDACDVDKQKAADASPVKAQIWTHLLYRHWDHFVGEQRSHVAVVDADSGRNLRDLTPRSVVGDAETPTFSLGGPLGYAWAPDSHEIAYVTNLEVGFAKPGVYPQPGESTNNDIFTLKLDEPGAKAVKVSTSPGSDDGPQYSPDGKWLAWRSQARNGYESDQFKLVAMDRASGNIENVTSKFDSWVDEFTWGPSSGEIYFASPEAGEEPVFVARLKSSVITELGRFVPLVGGTDILRVHVPFNAEFSGLTLSPDGQSLIAIGTNIARPSSVFRFVLGDLPKEMAKSELPTKGMRSIKVIGDHPSPASNIFYVPVSVLADPNFQLLRSLDLLNSESFWFAGANGTKVEGFLVKPPNFDPSKKYPVKFLIHGGPQGAWGDAWSYRWNPELFAASGYVVVMVNPRGSTGYGQRFLEEVSGDWGGRAYVDLMKGLDYAEQHYSFIDKDRECALGASYGGYMADWVLTHTNRFKCIVTHDGMYNPQSAFGTTEELWFNEWEFRPLAGNGPDAVVEQGKPAHPWDFYDRPASEDPFRKWAPMYFIKNAHTPTLVVHSQRDMRLDVSEGLQLFTALQLLGVPSKMLYFPDEGHWVLKPQNSQLWNEQVSDWCDQWLGMNKYAAAGPEKNPAAVK
jgi:dipeptidyl aminopeptidase/acylaminoacyl peptidase